jgi:hypothetical protein
MTTTVSGGSDKGLGVIKMARQGEMLRRPKSETLKQLPDEMSESSKSPDQVAAMAENGRFS